MSRDMDPALWQRVKAIVADAIERPREERLSFVRQITGGDMALLREIEELLAAADVDTSPLDAPPAGRMLEALNERVAGRWIGRTLGPWRLQALIARGGMGEVYRGERADGQYEQQVAVKVMRADADHAVLLERFRAERRILASLDHPNLAKLLDAGVTDSGAPWFVMELVEGEPIDAYCERRRLGMDDRLRLFRSVCQVVDYAHRKGVVHRDLKPSNILVRADGAVKLVDFGIAKQIGPIAGEGERTTTAYRALTPEYASPEQIRGEAATPASDVYALGVVLYRLLARTSPYRDTAGDAYALTRAICEIEPPPPSRAVSVQGPEGRSLRRQLQGGLDAVVMMALRKEPARRYATAEALADDVFRHLEGLPVQARHGAWSYRAGRFVLRHRAMLLAALVANLALVAGASVAGYQAYEAHLQRERAEHHFAEVRKLANVMLLDVHKAIAPLPGSTPARRLIVQNALAYLQQLSSEATDHAELRVELANGYRSIGDIQGRPYSANIGDAKGALESYDRGIALIRDLVQPSTSADAGQADAQAALAQLYQRKGTLLGSQGEDAEAERLVAQGVALMNDLAAHRPLGRELQLVRAAMHGQLSQVQRYAGNTEAFFRNSMEARRQYQHILSEAPNEEAAISGLATTYLEQGTYYFERDSEPATLAQAIQAFRRALELQQPVAEKHPDDVRLVRNLAAHRANLAAALMRAQQPRDAAHEYRLAHDLIADLSSKDRSNAQLRAELAIVTGSMSRALLANGEADAAVQAAQAAIEGYAGLPEGSLRDVNTRYKQGVAHYLLGQAQEARSNRTGACSAYRQSLPILQELEGRNGLGRTDITPATVQQALRRCG